jgi:hypothetical protein
MADKRVKLKSSDDEMFEVEEAVAFESQAVKNMIEDTGMDHPIPLPNVSSKILAKVIEYCKYHVDNQKSTDDKPATPEDEIKAWDQDFVKVDQATLFDLILVSLPPTFSPAMTKSSRAADVAAKRVDNVKYCTPQTSNPVDRGEHVISSLLCLANLPLLELHVHRMMLGTDFIKSLLTKRVKTLRSE